MPSSPHAGHAAPPTRDAEVVRHATARPPQVKAKDPKAKADKQMVLAEFLEALVRTAAAWALPPLSTVTLESVLAPGEWEQEHTARFQQIDQGAPLPAFSPPPRSANG